MSNFNELVDSHVRRLPKENGKGEPEPDRGISMALAMHSTAMSSAVQKVLIPEYRKRIEELDEEEGTCLGTPKQFEIRGQRLLLKQELSRWLKWSGQATAPDEETIPNAG